MTDHTDDARIAEQTRLARARLREVEPPLREDEASSGEPKVSDRPMVSDWSPEHAGPIPFSVPPTLEDQVVTLLESPRVREALNSLAHECGASFGTAFRYTQG